MAKKSKLARFKSRRKAKTNPEKAQIIELGYNAGAGFAAYAATRFASRVAYSQSVKRWPGAAPHLHVAASLVSALGVYYGSKYWSKAEDYHEAAVIGAGIAVLQTAIQTYVPKFGWIVADVRDSDYVSKAPAARPTLPSADMSSLLLDDGDAGIPDSMGDFDLDALLAEHPDVEAVEIGAAAPDDSFSMGASAEDDDWAMEAMH